MNYSFQIRTAKLSEAGSNPIPDIATSTYPRFHRAGLVRRILCTCVALALLYVYPFIRQANLNRSLARAIIADQDLEAMRLLDQGADARTLYYPSTDLPWWKQALDVLPRRRTNEPGRSLLRLMLDRQRANATEFLPPTRSHVALMEMLVAKGCPANVRDRWGRTPLEFAIDFDRYDFAVRLLDHGADANMPRIVRRIAPRPHPPAIRSPPAPSDPRTQRGYRNPQRPAARISQRVDTRLRNGGICRHTARCQRAAALGAPSHPNPLLGSKQIAAPPTRARLPLFQKPPAPAIKPVPHPPCITHFRNILVSEAGL